jgi:predicted ATPase/DNA-binding winged helix-turn-helix (wHTH) protein
MDDAKPAVPSGRYRCGSVEIDAAQRCLSIDGVPAKIGARAFDVLLALLERRDRVVPKRELMDVVWPRLVVEENNLLVQMVTLRKMLGPQAIATIPGRGYRFAMPVEVVMQAPLTASEFTVPPAGEPSAAERGNLLDPPPLFGRAQDLEAVDALLRAHAVVTIVGAGGIGKTCLAMSAGAAAAQLELPDGRWWVELAPINEGTQVPYSIAAALGLQLPPARTPEDAIADALASLKLLVVLDSCEHLSEEVASLVDILRTRAPNVRFLLTSQESLKCRDEQVYRLGPLAVPSNAQVEEAAQFGAVALLVARAHAVDPRFRLADDNVALVIDICRRLDGIPLAIELAAARLPLLGVSGLQARLDQMFNVLTGGARMKLRRHQTLRAALEWSHGLLSADEQAAFRRLGVFASGFTLELAQQVVADEGVDQWLVLDLLGHLIDKSLVIADGANEPRYRLLEITRAFALEQLAASDESDRILRRHAQVVCNLMATIDAHRWSLSPAERRSVVDELGNLRVAIEWALTSAGDRELACELLGKCWYVLMRNGLTRECAQRMKQLWPLPPNLPARIEADFCRGFARLNNHIPQEEHWQAARRADSLYRQLGDADELCANLVTVAAIGALRDSMPEAEQALREADRLITEATPNSKQAALEGARGGLYLRRGVPALAIETFTRQARLYREVGESWGECVALGNLGCAQLDAGDLDAAVESLRKSVDGLRRFHAPNALELRLGTLAVALAWRGDDVDVLPLARESFDNLRPRGVTFAPLMAAALQHARCGELQRAVLLTGYAHSVLPRQKHTRMIALPMKQRVLDRVSAEHSTATVDRWLCEGERLTEGQAAAIAFGAISLPGDESHETRRVAADLELP